MRDSGSVFRLRAVRLVGAAIFAFGAAVLSAGSGGSASAAGSGGNWLTYGGNFARSSDQPLSPRLRPLHALWTSPTLSGAIYGEPLIDGPRVYVATEADVVYALSARTGRVLWRRTLGRPVDSSALPCGDISPTLGVTSTMVIDNATDELFASAAESSGGAIHHQLVALDATSGRVRFRRVLDLRGWDSAAELQRAALGIDEGRVLIGFGGNYGDCGDYRGYLMAEPESGTGRTITYAIPTAREGAIWAPGGEAVEASGEILFATGNSASETSYDEGDSVVALSAGLRRLDSFAPVTWRADNATDNDLGSSAPALVPRGQVVIAGKSGTAYLLNENHLGGVGGQIASAAACNDRGGDAVLGADVFLACPDGSMIALRVGAGSLNDLWTAPSGVAGSPTVAGGLVWSVADGELFGVTPARGATAVRARTIPTENFAAPSAGDGLLVIGGQSKVQAFAGPSGYLG